MKYFFTHFFIFLFSVKFIFAQQVSLVEVDKVKLEKPNQEIPIIGSLRSKKITNVMFSKDEKKIMTISEDGVIIVRDLTF